MPQVLTLRHCPPDLADRSKQVREDISQNLHALEDLHQQFNTQILLIESGGDNLAANYSRELADYIIYVVCPPKSHITNSHSRVT